MNILVVGKFSAGHFGFHITDTLNDMGHQTIKFEPTSKEKYYKNLLMHRIHQAKQLLVSGAINSSFFRKRRKKRLQRILENQKVELTILTHDFLYPDEIKLIKKKTKAPIALWFPDSIANFGKAFFLISEYDALFFKDPYIVKILRDQYNKKNVYYLPECCNPKYHKRITLSEEDINKYGCDITTYGSPHNIRSSFFRQLMENNYSIKIWGHQPPIWLKNSKIKSLYTGEYVFDDSKAKTVLGAKINLNTLLPSEIVGLNARTFEIAGIGGFQMIQWRPGLSQLFNDGKDLVSFNNFKELLEKMNYYLKNSTERIKIANAGQVRAYGEHTYEKRLKIIFDTIFGNSNGFDSTIIDLKI